MTPLITIAVQCHNFQKRLCWMLSSLAQQTQPDLVMVDVAHIAGNGNPTTESVCDLFRPYVAIKQSLWTDYQRFGMRGYVRTRQLQKCTTEWILFSDADMVYGPEYFERLAEELKNHSNARYLIASGRRTCDIEPANQLVDSCVKDSPAIVPDAFAKALPISWRRIKGPRGVGNSQIANVKHGAHGGVYVPDDANPDKGWHTSRGQDTRSDLRFRGRMCAGGPRFNLPEWFSANIMHLNHNRDKQAGKHIEEQR